MGRSCLKFRPKMSSAQNAGPPARPTESSGFSHCRKAVHCPLAGWQAGCRAVLYELMSRLLGVPPALPYRRVQCGRMFEEIARGMAGADCALAAGTLARKPEALRLQSAQSANFFLLLIPVFINNISNKPPCKPVTNCSVNDSHGAKGLKGTECGAQLAAIRVKSLERSPD